MTQIFKVPSPGLDPRGVDIDSNGVVWTALAASSHLASFDVRKCRDLAGPAKLDGSQCANGWSLYKTTGPTFTGTTVPTDFHYFNWTDIYGASGFPPNTPMATGSNSDSILVLTSQQGAGTWATLRVPYPLGFYARGLDARNDSANRSQPASWLEEPRDLVQLRHALRVAHRRRQGRQGQTGEIPGSPESSSPLVRANEKAPGKFPGAFFVLGMSLKP